MARMRIHALPTVLVTAAPLDVRRVGVHGRAAVIADFGAQFLVPGVVAVDPA